MYFLFCLNVSLNIMKLKNKSKIYLVEFSQRKNKLKPHIFTYKQ